MRGVKDQVQGFFRVAEKDFPALFPAFEFLVGQIGQLMVLDISHGYGLLCVHTGLADIYIMP